MDFSKYRILVLGDAFLDEYQFGECTRISQEAPVPIVQIDHTKTKWVPGGAGNVAANITSLGAKCGLGCMVGEDPESDRLFSLLRKKGIEPIEPAVRSASTIVKTRIIAQNQQIVRLDRESNQGSGLIARWFTLRCIETCDAVIVSDYNKGYFDRTLAAGIIDTAIEHKKLVVVDTKPSNVEWFRGADWFTPNLKEYLEMPNIAVGNVLITKGAEGMDCLYQGKRFSIPAIRHEVVDVAGAGDTAVAAFTLALVDKMPIEEAVNFANLAAGVVVGKQGTSTVTIKEIEALQEEVYGVRIKDTEQ